MARPSKEIPRSSRLVPALLRFAGERGLDAALIAARVNLPLAALDADETAVPTALISDVLTVIADALGEPHLGLLLPKALPNTTYELPELVARSSANVRDALSRLARYASLVHPSVEAALEESASVARFVLRTPGHARGVGEHAQEYVLAYVLTHARAQSDAEMAVSSAWFAHARPADLAPLHRFFGARDLAFGAADSGFSIDRATLETRSPAFDPRLLATAEALAENALAASPRDPSMLPLLTARLMALLPHDANIDSAARALHMSPRTLQRRLELCGATFSEVLDTVRQDAAKECLADDTISLAEITHRLGFSDLAAFSRAFKRWTGKPPGAWRKSHNTI